MLAVARSAAEAREGNGASRDRESPLRTVRRPADLKMTVLPRMVATDPSGPTTRRRQHDAGLDAQFVPVVGSSTWMRLSLVPTRRRPSSPNATDTTGAPTSASSSRTGWKTASQRRTVPSSARRHDVRADSAGERRRRDPVVVAGQREERRARLRIEDARGAVSSGRHDLLAVRAERDSSQAVSLPGEDGLQSPVATFARRARCRPSSRSRPAFRRD